MTKFCRLVHLQQVEDYIYIIYTGKPIKFLTFILVKYFNTRYKTAKKAYQILFIFAFSDNLFWHKYGAKRERRYNT